MVGGAVTGGDVGGGAATGGAVGGGVVIEGGLVGLGADAVGAGWLGAGWLGAGWLGADAAAAATYPDPVEAGAPLAAGAAAGVPAAAAAPVVVGAPVTTVVPAGAAAPVVAEVACPRAVGRDVEEDEGWDGVVEATLTAGAAIRFMVVNVAEAARAVAITLALVAGVGRRRLAISPIPFRQCHQWVGWFPGDRLRSRSGEEWSGESWSAGLPAEYWSAGLSAGLSEGLPAEYWSAGLPRATWLPEGC